MNGKQKCNILKNIRRDIAKANDIPLNIPECSHKGDCLGTCPRCEAEMRFLERSLEARRKRGFKIALAGISAGLIAVNATSCDVIDDLGNLIHGEQLQGDMIIETSDGLIAAPSSEPEMSKQGELENTSVVTLEGDVPLITELAGEVNEEEFVLDGDIAVFTMEADDLIKGILLAPEDEITSEDHQINCQDSVHAPGVIPKSDDANSGSEEE